MALMGDIDADGLTAIRRRAKRLAEQVASIVPTVRDSPRWSMALRSDPGTDIIRQRALRLTEVDEGRPSDAARMTASGAPTCSVLPPIRRHRPVAAATQPA